ncbi:MAG TPA: tetratricopeptide repeat protein [Spirochaetota bacterium]|nr:tetratricopeptide repeat protein [Spirochaetota bacterium]
MYGSAHHAMRKNHTRQLVRAFAALIITLIIANTGARSATAKQADTATLRDLAREHNRAGIELLDKKDYASARDRFDAAIALDPAVKYYHNNIAVACMNLGRYDQAVTHLERAIRLDPFYARALSNLGISCFHLSEYRKAYGYYLRAKAADRAYTEERFRLAKVIHGMERIHHENPGNTVLKNIIREVKGMERMP